MALSKTKLFVVVLAVAVAVVLIGFVIASFMIGSSVPEDMGKLTTQASEALCLSAKTQSACINQSIISRLNDYFPNAKCLWDFNASSCKLCKQFDSSGNCSEFQSIQKPETSPQFCNASSDCTLLVCSGCYNKEYAKNPPPYLPCYQYPPEQFACDCVSNQCVVSAKP